jgi:hypothetical protein
MSRRPHFAGLASPRFSSVVEAVWSSLPVSLAAVVAAHETTQDLASIAADIDLAAITSLPV